MRYPVGRSMQAAGSVLLFLLAGASDAGGLPVSGILYGFTVSALLFLAGRRLTRPRRRVAAVVPLRTPRRKRVSMIECRRKATGV